MPKIADIEPTPNPNARRFVLKEPLTHGAVRSYENSTQAASDPLAAELFAIAHVTNVYYVDKYLTVTQDGLVPWNELERQVAVPIRAAQAQEVASPTPKADVAENLSPEDVERLATINAILDEQVRPALMMDGGGLEIVGLEGNKLKIHYQGACGTCPSAIFGTLAGIEGLLRGVEPDIELVAV
ncbi:MAG TPA: NifU family protein [Oscillatoriaceae cyanobacterium]